jgi:hypothetical protein
MPKLQEALKRGSERARNRSNTDDSHAFQEGADWVRQVLIPAITEGNAELEPEHVAFQLDLNMDPRSTNHAHADFWLSEVKEGQRAVGPEVAVAAVVGPEVGPVRGVGPGRERVSRIHISGRPIRA